MRAGQVLTHSPGERRKIRGPDRGLRFAHDSLLEGAVSSEPVSGVRFPGYWEKIQGISAESQQERF